MASKPHNRLRDFLADTGGEAAGEAKFARTALEKEFISTAQLEECLDERDRRRAGGEDVRLGEILIRRGVLTAQGFLDVLGIQDLGLRVCLACGRVYDVSGQPSDVKLRCVKCGVELGHAPAGPRKAPGTGSGIRPAVQVPSDTRPRLGKYALTREIGVGGVAVVYEAEDPELKRKVALKVLKESETGPRVIARLHREAAIAAQLAHPNIVAIHEVAMARDQFGASVHFIAMDYIEGTTLAHVLAARKTPLAELLRMLEDTSRAVAHAHSKGVVHRDLKPSNVLVDKNGRVVLTDFGVAHAESFNTKLTRTQAVMGTPQYMSPEQVQGKTSDINERTDVYSLGVMLYEMLTGRMPFEADVVADLYRRILEDEPKRPSTISRHADDELEAICLKAMEKRAEDRYPGAHELAEDLARHRRGDPVQARAVPGWKRLRRRLAKNRAVLIPTGIAVLLGLVIGSVAVAAITGAPDPRGVPAVIAAGALNLLLLFLVLRRFRAGKDKDTDLARERSRVHADAGRSLLTRLDRLLSTPQWTDAELAQTAEDAREEFRSALREFPRSPEAALDMARAYRLEGKRDDAIEWCTRAVELSAYFPTALLERAILKLEKYEEMRHDKYGRQKDPGPEGTALRREIDAELLQVKGSTRERREVMLADGILAHADGEYEKAAKALEEYARATLTDPEGWKWCGRAWLQIPGREDLAAAALTEALRFRPRDVAAIRLRAKARFQNRDLEGALADFDLALRTRPDEPALLNSRGVVRDSLGDYEGALADYSESLKLREAPEVYVNRGAAHRARGFVEKAIADYNRAIELNPRLADAWMNRGVARKTGGDIEGAVADFNEALKIAPKFASIWVNLGVALHSKGEVDRGIEALNEAIRLRPNFAEAFFNRAAAREFKKDWAGALADCNEALRLSPKMEIALVQRGLVKHEMRDLDGAWDDYDAALRMNPENAEAFAHRGAVHKDRGNFNGALADYDTSLRLNARNPEAHMYRAELFLAIGDTPGAKAELAKAIETSTPDWAFRARVEGLIARLNG
ncbi:MAG: tetratricopeptide repeat protein [Planctomycetes bacterium]|nr:tetratricopeptide repeat protein [Planctomycetota bacterium]